MQTSLNTGNTQGVLCDMGIKRVVDTSFWTDGKVDEFSPEDKYFMLYLLTNPFSTQLGIYEISIKQAAFQMGYSVDAFNVLLDRFENKYNVILFSRETNEIAILNFLQHSIIKGGAPVRDCLIKEMKSVKNKALIAGVFEHLKNKPNFKEFVNATVQNIISEYQISAGDLRFCNEKNNGKRYANESYNESYNDTGYDTGNNENDNENDNENVIDSATDKKVGRKSTKPVRHKYGEYKNVMLTDEDFEKLKNEFPVDWEERIERLSSYIASSGKSYKNHLATIRNWARKDKETNAKPKQTNSTDDFMAQLAALRTN